MLGGYSQLPLEDLPKVQQIVNTNVAAINQAIGLNGASFTVRSAQAQIVAGTNYFIHLTSNEDRQYGVNLFIGLDGNLGNISVDS